VVIKNDNKAIPTYRFNKDYRQWKVLSKKQPVIKSDNKLLSKVMDTKDNITKDNIYIVPFLGEFENVKITDKELNKLKDRFNSTYLDRIENLSRYIENFPTKGKRYKSHYATILTWARKDKPKQKPDRNSSEAFNV